MVSGGLLVGDNAISHAADLAGWLARVQSDPRVDSVLVPIGTGDMLCRRK
jgi:predicted O-methyltransferase YrrM